MAASLVCVAMKSRSRGFTMVELVFVLMLVGILSLVAVPRLFDRSEFDARGYADSLAAAARYARTVAVASGCPVQVAVTAAGYAVNRPATFCDAASFPAAVNEPGGTGALAGNAPTGVAVAGVPLTFEFGADGSTDLGADATVTVGAHAVRVVASTGFVETP